MRMLYWPLRSPASDSKRFAGQCGKVSEREGHLQAVELQARGAFYSKESLDPFSGREVPGPLVPIADDHSYLRLAGIMRYVKHNSEGPGGHTERAKSSEGGQGQKKKAGQ